MIDICVFIMEAKTGAFLSGVCVVLVEFEDSISINSKQGKPCLPVCKYFSP
jgi:hypothetical protein